MTAPARISGPGPDGRDDRTPDGPDRPDRPATADRPVGIVQPTAAERVSAAVHTWRESLVERAGESALADVQRLGDAVLDLSAAHPSGIAQLFAGRPTHLSNLVREGGALSVAKRRARAVGLRADDHAQRYGLASAFLAIGIATWTEEVVDGGAPGTGRDDVGALAHALRPSSTTDDTDRDGEGPRRRTLHAPVLLRPVAVHPRGRGESDYDLALDPSLEINPLLAGALRARGALLDPAALARGAFTAGGFDPRPALERLRALGAAVLDEFHLEDRLLVGTFVHPEQVLVDDLDAQSADLARHEVVTALAGDQRSIDALSYPLPLPVRGDRDPDDERGVGDLDTAQAHVLDAVAAGHHLLVDAPAGSDVAGTLAAVVADAAASGRTVLYVAGHRRSATAVVDRLTALGLGDLVLDVAPDSGWRSAAARRLLGAMTIEAAPVDASKVDVVRRELLDRRGRLHSYIEGLHTRREPWGVSPYDALQALARLTSTRPSPQTRVRLTAPVAEALDSENRSRAAADLVRAAGLGAFAPAVRASGWFGAVLLTQDLADAALQRIDRLLDTSLPTLQEQVAAVAGTTGLTPAATPAQWSEQLRMLAGVRGALDVFQPIIFERSAADLIAATASRQWRAERGITMSRVLRQRLRRQAKDLLRPGRPVADLHGALVDVQAQREVWRAHCPAGGWPRIPEGLAHIEHDFGDVDADLRALEAVLVGTVGGGELSTLPWADLVDRLHRLRQDRSALDALPERTTLVRNLERRGLADLLADLADRRVPTGLVAAELDLTWWSTVLEQLLAADPALAGYDGAALGRLVAEFRTLDRRFLTDRAALVRDSTREALRTRLRAADEQTQLLFGELVEDRFTSLRQTAEAYPEVARHLRPCLVAAPMLVPQLLPPTRSEDLVILDAAGHLPLETVVSALARGRQVLVVGDTRSASGTALQRLAEVLPAIALHADTSRRDPYLTAFLSDHGYSGRLTATPLPQTRPLLGLHVVDGSGMPTPDGAVEGTQAEVAHVVELVVEHALRRPEESLAVVTASAVHAERVRDAVLAEVRDNPSLGTFFRTDQPEPFVVAEMGATSGLSREAVIISVGFGRTPHGRVLHRFGALSEPGGDGMLLEALGSTRHRLTVVSCFTADDLDPERLRAPGARLLADLLALAAERTGAPDTVRSSAPDLDGPEPDRLVLDLAERLWRLGLVVDVDHGIPGGAHIPLVVGHPDLPGEMLVAVLTDDATYVGEPSIRVRDRQVAERLERLGWTVVQVWSAAAFGEPQAEAEAICAVTVEAWQDRVASRPAPRPVPTVPEVTDEGPDDDEAEQDVPRDGGPHVGTSQDVSASHDISASQDVSASQAVSTLERAGVDDGSVTDDADPAFPPGRSTDGPEVTAEVREPLSGGDRPVPADLRPTASGTPSRSPASVARPSSARRRPSMPALFDPPTPPGRGPRPPVEAGLPIGAYSDDQLDDLIAWITSDGVRRDADRLAADLRAELGITRRGSRVDATVRAAVRRAP
ncbi:hypothetical protein [Actinotalea sp. K2]|uniref:hypothetical protein n=1 Tax=Actinotalea sp. K2 TaxID=2939438 RepID=UPI002016E24F|nr:hypothetical protein [Actinotalea sp. K2]MCL3861250.1 hypothetical protein [Actinotalea sp. K2]